MARKSENRGTCAYCGEVLTRRSFNKHLDVCAGRENALTLAVKNKKPEETLWHIRAQDAYSKDFFIDLEINGSARLSHLDEYLRAIWLECCGHLSHFSIRGWGGEKIPISWKIDAVFSEGLVLRHLYDYGTTSETDIHVIGCRLGKPTSRPPITLLFRNLVPAMECHECGEEASWLCLECMFDADGDMSWFLCDRHVKQHPHDEYGDPLPLVNSPRLGMCGYDGPAEPPY